MLDLIYRRSKTNTNAEVFSRSDEDKFYGTNSVCIISKGDLIHGNIDRYVFVMNAGNLSYLDFQIFELP